MRWTRQLLFSSSERRSQKGIAIIMAVFCLALISYIVTEVSYETAIEYNIHSQSISRLKAYYAARSALELSLLRIKLYRKIQSQFGDQLPPEQQNLLNLIWNFPLGWPPTLPDESSAVEKEMVKDKIKETKMDATYTATITDEGSKIDLNDLDSPSKTIRELTKKQILTIFESKMEQDKDWAKDHRDFRAEELVNNIIDWMDSDKESKNNGDERSYYKNTKQETWPPNRAFRTLEELHLVAGMTEEMYDLLAPRVTIYGAKALNPNTATREMLQSLDPTMTDEVVTEVLKRRDNLPAGGPYKDKKDFWDYVNAKGGRVDPKVIEETPLIFNAVTNFRIQAIGEYHGSIREIDAVVFDMAAAASTVAAKAKTDNQDPNSPNPSPSPSPSPSPAPGPGGTNAGNKKNNQLSKGPPRIVYWYEK